MCCGCTHNCQKWGLIGSAITFLIIGIVLVFFTDDIVNAVKKNEFNLGSRDTIVFGMWEVTPIPMFSEFYLFNWTNSEEVLNSSWTIPPRFEQLGPYTFSEKHYRENITFNANHTVTYQTKRIWHFVSEKTNGSLDDVVTCINPILVTVSNIVKYKHPIVRLGVNFFLEEKRVNFTVSKTVRELIFEGYEDPLLDLLHELHLRHMEIPFTKFAWFVDRNESAEADGVYNMFDGTKDLRDLGKFYSWNYKNHTPFYEGECGAIGGTSGEIMYPVLNDDSIEIFSPDLCSTITLVRTSDIEMFGLTGHRFVYTEKNFDNGSNYPESACFSPGEVLPSGVRNISECKFNCPGFISLPHFTKADPYYNSLIEGLHPDPEEFNIDIAIEPETGIPFYAKVAAQISLLVEPRDRIKLLENVKFHLSPILWFRQYATLTSDLAAQAKLLIILPTVGQGVGYGLIGLGVLSVCLLGFLVWYRTWKGRQEDSLLSDQDT